MQFVRALAYVAGRELTRRDVGSHATAVCDASGTHVDGWDDHHGRRRASADVRGYRGGVARIFRTTTRLRPGSTSPTPSEAVGTIDAISPPKAAQAFCAPGSSASTRPFHTIASPPTRRNGSRYSVHCPRLPTARAVPTSY